MLDRLAGRSIPSPPAARRTVFALPQERRQQPGFVGTLDLVPDLSVRIAKTCARAQRLRVRERQGGSFQDLRLFAIRCAAGGFGAREAHLVVGAVAERLSFRLARPAELGR